MIRSEKQIQPSPEFLVLECVHKRVETAAGVVGDEEEYYRMLRAGAVAYEKTDVQPGSNVLLDRNASKHNGASVKIAGMGGVGHIFVVHYSDIIGVVRPMPEVT